MYGDDYKIAVFLYFIGIALVLTDFLTLEGIKEHRGAKKAIIVLISSLMATVCFALSVAWIQVRISDVRGARLQETSSAVQVNPASIKLPALHPIVIVSQTSVSRVQAKIIVVITFANTTDTEANVHLEGHWFVNGGEIKGHSDTRDIVLILGSKFAYESYLDLTDEYNEGLKNGTLTIAISVSYADMGGKSTFNLIGKIRPDSGVLDITHEDSQHIP